jgi:flagellar biosynthesis protein FlhF
MRLKLYWAPAMADAMARVRSELGAEALILATRRVNDGVEITAALEMPEDLPATLPRPEVITALEFHNIPSALRSALQQGDVEAALAQTLAFATLPLHAAPLLLVGTPGAGKTLTVARLAAPLVMSGILPVVVSADGKRAGATEQLAAFTRLLGIRLMVACDPVTLGRALANRQPGTPVLIDSAGCNPFNVAQMEELAALAATVGAAMVPIIPAGLDPPEAADQAEAYRACGARLMLATRLDVARRLGGLLAAAATGLALTLAGVSADVADGLRPITPAWLAERLLAGVHR